MSDLEVLENIGTAAVMELRKEKLASGKSFMINSDQLPAKQAYMEYPDGTINIETMAPGERSFLIVHKLTAAEALAVRKRYDLK
jgi:hypothetical protein